MTNSKKKNHEYRDTRKPNDCFRACLIVKLEFDSDISENSINQSKLPELELIFNMAASRNNHSYINDQVSRRRGESVQCVKQLRRINTIFKHNF